MAEALASRFVGVKLLLGEDREATRRYRPFWTPTLFFLDPNGHPLLDWPGFIPARAFLPFLDLGEGLVGLRRGRFPEALELLQRVSDRYPDSVFAPESLWWLGAAQQVVNGDVAGLERTRREILERYPTSPAALRV